MSPYFKNVYSFCPNNRITFYHKIKILTELNFFDYIIIAFIKFSTKIIYFFKKNPSLYSIYKYNYIFNMHIKYYVAKNFIRFSGFSGIWIRGWNLKNSFDWKSIDYLKILYLKGLLFRFKWSNIYLSSLSYLEIW